MTFSHDHAKYGNLIASMMEIYFRFIW